MLFADIHAHNHSRRHQIKLCLPAQQAPHQQHGAVSSEPLTGFINADFLCMIAALCCAVLCCAVLPDLTGFRDGNDTHVTVDLCCRT